MAHVAKYTRGQVMRLINHYNRAEEAPAHRSNENIDHELTKENVNLMARDISPEDYFKQRIGEVYYINRDDVKFMCDWVVTLPKDYDGDPMQFFEHTVDMLNEKYGERNCIGAFVHKDETTWHMHYAFIPVVKDPKHEQGERLNAKAVTCRRELQRFHGELQDYLREKMPDKTINVYRDEEQREKDKRDRALEEFKAHEREQRVLKLKEEVHRQEIDLKARRRDLERQKEQQQKELQRYVRYYDAVERYKADRDMSDSEYWHACWKAEQGLERYPAPEAMNPDRQDKSNVEREEKAPERTISRER